MMRFPRIALHRSLAPLVLALLASMAMWTITAGWASASLIPYDAASDLLATTPGTDDGAIGAMLNPAQWGLLERPELAIFTNDDPSAFPGRRDVWGFATGSVLGFSMRREGRHDAVSRRHHVTDYQVGLGFGSRERASGIALGFSGAGKGAFDRSSFLTFGSIRRPTRWLSYGSSFQVALDDKDLQGITDVGIRPLSSRVLLLFGDYALRRGERWDEGALGGGVAMQPIPGLLAAARWERDERFQVTVGVALGRSAFRATPRYRDGDHVGTQNVLRFDSPQRGIDIDGRVKRGRRTMALDLHGRLVYQSHRYFDEEALPLRDVTRKLQFAIDDPTVGGVAVRLSGFEGNLSMAWEIREKLAQVKRAGKRATVVCDNLDARTAYVASVADRIVMDPRGSFLFPGVLASRTYLHGLLGKLGIGFEEWRYYKYKSAVETFSRDRMSDADREQYGTMVNATYDELARGFVASGRVTRVEFDRVVNEQPYLPASRLLELHWVDALGRWDDLERAEIGAPEMKPMKYEALRERRWQPRDEWGPDPAIALVYLVGDCAMDDGIRARASSEALRAFRKDRAVKAVVLRVDSPGGDPLASDVVAGETRKLREAKRPTLVSQGRVAASGGYWISMDAEPIVTSPFTLTGSIGIIGGWAWNEGFGKKTGLSSDHVKAGASADLLGGIRIPFLGGTLPERNLNAGERRLIEGAFEEMYTDFTNKVASARGLDPARVRELAEGRVYDGAAAVRLKLADRLGTLDDTIEEAKRRAGLRPGARVRVVEYPKRPLFRLPSFLGRPGIGASSAEWPAPGFQLEARALQSILDRPGRPLVLVPGSLLPDEPEPVR